MKTQSEEQLEQELIKALVSNNNYGRSMVKTEDQLIKNIKQKLEILNHQKYSEEEFRKNLNDWIERPRISAYRFWGEISSLIANSFWEMPSDNLQDLRASPKER